MRAILSIVMACGLAGCSIIYKLPTRQGNLIEQEKVDQLQPGMTREQVQYVMGTAIAGNPFEPDRWDYLAYYRSPRGKLTTRQVSVFFEGQTLVRIEGAEHDAASDAASEPDIETVIRQEKKDDVEKERSDSEQDSGVVISPD